MSNICYSQKIITSFEKENSLSNVEATDGVRVFRSTDFPALGAYSCKVNFPESGGTVFINNLAGRYQENIEGSGANKKDVFLCFIWTNEISEIKVVFKDSLNKIFSKQHKLKKGANHIQLLLSEVNNIDLQRLKSIGINTNSSQVFYLDYFAFDQFQPVLDKLGRWDVEYSTEIQTPHYPWGKELVNGPIKSYSISPVFDGRGIVELAQRLDLEMNVTTMGRRAGAERYGYGDFYKRRVANHGDSTSYNLAHNYMAENLLFNPEMDVIIWPGIHKWESFSKQVRDAVLERVNQGTGLVLLYPISDRHNASLWDVSPLKSIEASKAQVIVKDREMWTWPENLDMTKWSPTEAHYITRGVVFEAFPWGHMGALSYQNNSGKVLLETERGNPVLAVKKYGKGRVVAMAYPEKGLLPRIDNPWETGLNYPYWEYMWSLVARSVVWAADRNSETAIENVMQTHKGLAIRLNNILKKSSVNIQVTDEFGMLEKEMSVSVSIGQTMLEIDFDKKLSGGKHLVKLQLKGEEGTYDWYSMQFETDKIAKIASIESESNEMAVGEKVRAKIGISSKSKIKGMLTAHLYDNYGRLVDEQMQEVRFKGDSTFNVTLDSKKILTNLGKLEILLHADGKQQDHKTEEIFFLQPRNWDDYDVTMYHFGPNPVPGTWHGIDQQLQELNVTTLAAYTLDNSKHANYKVQAQTRIHGVESPDGGADLEYYQEMVDKYLETQNKHLLVRKYGLSDSTYLNAVREELTKKIGDWKKFSPSAYYIYEEPSVTRYDGALDLDFSKASLSEMRKWLRSQYNSLKALNLQWGTNFDKWQDVIPDDSFEARERGNYSSWADHRTFMEVSWANHFKLVQQIVHELDPDGLVQLSGTQATSSHNGYDYSLINQYVGQMNPYDIDNQLEYHLTFNPKLKISGQAGYGKMGKSVLYDYYHHLFLKETGGSYIFWQVSSMNPDFRINRAGTAMKKGFDELLKRGIGRLVSSYQPENELKIAIHYSYPSVHAAWIVDGKISANTGNNDSKTLVQFNKNRDGWVKSLHDLGFGFEFIAYNKIEAGGLIAGGYKVLILPMSYAISDLEVKEIEAFVKAGGIVVADALPGVMDNHTKFRKTRALADVFGIAGSPYSREELVTPEAEIKLKTRKSKPLIKEKSKPELVYNKYGKGSAYLLNYFMDKYPKEKLNQNNEVSLAKLRGLFERENIGSSIRITKPNGSTENSIEKYSFSKNDEATQLLGLLPGKGGKDRGIILHIKEQMHLYNIRNKEYIGEGKVFKIWMKKSVPELFGLVKTRIESFRIDAPSKAKRNEKITITIDFDQELFSDFTSVASIDVYNPSGERTNHYSKNCDIKNGVGQYSFTTALNDTSGRWKIRITEVISGLEKEVSILIE